LGNTPIHLVFAATGQNKSQTAEKNVPKTSFLPEAVFYSRTRDEDTRKVRGCSLFFAASGKYVLHSPKIFRNRTDPKSDSDIFLPDPACFWCIGYGNAVCCRPSRCTLTEQGKK
jgi:hypothetical protein